MGPPTLGGLTAIELMVVIAMPIVLLCGAAVAVYCVCQKYSCHHQSPPSDVDTSLLMPEEPQSLRELYDWSQSGSGSGILLFMSVTMTF